MPMAVAQRYASALAEISGPRGDYKQIAEDLASFAAVYQESSELREVFDSPAVLPRQKEKVLAAILDRLQTSELATRFLRVLLAHYRVNLLEEIRAAFQNIVNDRLGILQMKVVSASPLSQNQQTALQERFSDLTEKKVAAEYQVDPALVGGITAQIKSTVYDGSVRGYLDRIREQMGAQ